jgi:hypothetical protein
MTEKRLIVRASSEGRVPLPGPSAGSLPRGVVFHTGPFVYSLGSKSRLSSDCSALELNSTIPPKRGTAPRFSRHCE